MTNSVDRCGSNAAAERAAERAAEARREAARRAAQERALALGRVTRELSAVLGRAPSVAELAEAMEVSQEDVLDAMHAGHAYDTVSLEAQRSRPL